MNSLANVPFSLFLAEDFTDLPILNWAFLIEVTAIGGIWVKAYKILSEDQYYMRSISYEGNWIGGWKKFSFEEIA